MTDNLAIWGMFADIDPAFTRPITGKPYKGTSPNPHYVVRCLTEMFGPVGQGWGLRVVSEGFQPLGDEVLHWCRIEFWHSDRANTFEQYGQTKALMNTRNGIMSDEDAPKKSITDALVKCASYVGIASNIFLGRWDDQKYVQQVAEEYAAGAAAKAQADSDAAFAKAIDDAKREIRRETTLESLGLLWKSLDRAVQADPSVIAAKNARKDELTPVKEPILADEIPY